MFTKVLSRQTKKALALLGKSKFFQKAYLAGGTSLALQFGHRTSHDLDFYTKIPFEEKQEAKKIAKLGKFKLERTAWRTIIGKLEEANLSVFFYEYPLLKTPRKFQNVSIASAEDISAMKIAAIVSRGTKRDFVDLYFLCQKAAPLKKLLNFYEKKYQNLATQLPAILRSLTYFKDANPEKMPKMFEKIPWQTIKEFFQEESLKLCRQLLK